MTRAFRAIRFPRAFSTCFTVSTAFALFLAAGHAFADDVNATPAPLQPVVGSSAAPGQALTAATTVASGQTPAANPAAPSGQTSAAGSLLSTIEVAGGAAGSAGSPAMASVSGNNVPGGAAANIAAAAPTAGGMAEVPASAANANEDLSGVQLLPTVERPLHHFYCVEYARLRSGLEIFGDAKLWWTRARNAYAELTQPVANAVMVFAGSNRIKRGHVAVVTQVVSTREIRVDQANWQNHGEIDHATPVLDVSPNNDWSVVRVWDMASGQFGGHIYAIKGFITRALVAQTKT